MKFIKFDMDNVGELPYNGDKLLFICEDEVVRSGYLCEDYYGNGSCDYYFLSNGIKYKVGNNGYYCKFEVIIQDD